MDAHCSSWYLNHLSTHILASQRTILGQPSTTSQSLQSSFVPPTNTLWTPAEKSSFFAALSRHSRYRPDLVALDSGKSETEVVWYLEALESARKKDEDEVVQKRRNKKSELTGSHRFQPGLSPACREVSNEWIEKETGLANNVSDMLAAKEQVDQYTLRKKRKRKEKSELAEKLQDLRGKKGTEKMKAIEEQPEMEKLNRRWAVEDWLEAMDLEKLIELDRLIQHIWLEEYQDDVVHLRAAAPQPLSEDPVSDDPDTPSPHANADNPVKGDPNGKIIRDLHTMATISSISKKQRTPEQRQLLAKVINRQRCREQYRTKKLLDEGMTRDEIMNDGGADAIFARRNGLRIPAPVPVMTRTKEKGTSENYTTYEYVKEKGLDVFNYSTMAQIIQGQDTSQPIASLKIIQQLYSELLFYLKPLIYETVVLAEQSVLQEGLNQSAPIAEANTEDGIALKHVERILHLRTGRLEPAIYVGDPALGGTDGSDVVDAQDGEQEKSGGGISSVRSKTHRDRQEYSSVLRSRHYCPAEYMPPSELPWSYLSSLTTSTRPTGPTSSVSSQLESESSSSGSGEDDEEEGDSREDEALHLAQDIMDEQKDEIYENDLWKAVEDEDDLHEPEDETDGWWKNDHEPCQAQKDYIELYLQTFNARGQRRLAGKRRGKHPAVHDDDDAKQRETLLSKAFIDDGDTEHDEEEVPSGGDVEIGSRADSEEDEEEEEDSRLPPEIERPSINRSGEEEEDDDDSGDVDLLMDEL